MGAVPSSEASADVHRFAVVVGANRGAEYRVALRHAERDARKMADVLQQLGGIAAEDIALLVDDPTAAQVVEALKTAQSRGEAHLKSGETVSLFFYYSGHSDEKALELSGTRLSLKGLRSHLRGWTSGVRLAVLDACHSGAAVRLKGGTRTHKPIRFGVDGGVAEGYAILTSSAAGEESQESDELLGSFFTHHLVSGLRGAADADSDRRVTLNEAYRYAYARTLQATARKAAVAQHPHFDLALRGGQDVVLTSLAGSGARVDVPGNPDQARWILYDADRGLVLAEVRERKVAVTTVSVPAGDIEVYRRSGAGVARGMIRVPPDGSVVLTPDALERVPLTAYLRKGDAGMSVGAHIGLQSFTSPSTVDRFIGAAPILSLTFSLHDLGVFGLDLVSDVSFTSMGQTLQLYDATWDQTVTEVQVGSALMYRMDFGRLSVSAGPRVAYLHLERRVKLDHYLEGVSDGVVNTVAAGVALGVQWRFSPRISVGLGGRASWTPFPESDDGFSPERDQFLVDLQAAAAFHF